LVVVAAAAAIPLIYLVKSYMHLTFSTALDINMPNVVNLHIYTSPSSTLTTTTEFKTVIIYSCVQDGTLVLKDMLVIL